MSKFTAIGSRRTIKSSLMVLCIGMLLMGVSLGVFASQFQDKGGKGLYAAGLSFYCNYEQLDRLIICDGGTWSNDRFQPTIEIGWEDDNYFNSTLGGVVYNEAVYVFWTTTDGKLRYGKGNPSRSGKGDPHTIATGISDHGASAAVMGDVLYVFTTSHTFTSTDGKNFVATSVGPPPHAGAMLDAVTFFPKEKGSPEVMVVYLDGDAKLRSSFFTGTSFSIPETLPYPFDLNLKMGNLVLGTSKGQLGTGAKALSIQFYGLTETSSSWINPIISQLGRWEYNLEKNTWTAPQDMRSYPFSSLAVAPWFKTIDSKGTMHLQHALNLSGFQSFAYWLVDSDYMIPQHNDHTWGWAGVPTSTSSGTGDDDDAKKLRNLWSLVGVVLGPPPFAFNGASDASGLSDVQYGIDQSQSVTTTHTSSQTLSVGSETTIQGGIGEANFDFSYAHGWTSSHGTTHTVEVSTFYTFGPASESVGEQGIHGWAIFNAPILITQRFKNYAYDKSTYLGQDMYTTSTGSIVQQTAYFNLQAPSNGSVPDLFKGMDKYPYSTDLAGWSAYNWNPDPNNSNWTVKFGDVSNPPVGILSQGVNTTQVYTETKSTMDSKGNSNSFSVSAGVSFDIIEGFSEDIKMGYDAEFETTTDVETTLTKSVSSSLNMPIPPDTHGYIKNLSIQPYWLQAKTEAAPWIPKDYNGNLPWAIIWHVLHYDTIGGGSAGIAPEPYSATGTFQTGMEKMDRYSIDTGHLSWLDEDGGEIPLSMTAGDFDPALGAMISGNGYVLPMNETNGKWIRQGDQWMWFSSPNVNQDSFDLKLDFANGTWFFEAQAYYLDKIFLIADRQVHIQLELQGIYQFSNWMENDVKAIWSHEEIDTAQDLENTEVRNSYGVDEVEGAYESGSEAGYLFLKGRIPESVSSFGDVEIIINNSGVSIPLLSTEGFLEGLGSGETVGYKEENLSFELDFKTGEWEVLIVDDLFTGDMAPKKGSLQVQMLIGGEQVSDQTMELEEHSSMLNFWGLF